MDGTESGQVIGSVPEISTLKTNALLRKAEVALSPSKLESTLDKDGCSSYIALSPFINRKKGAFYMAQSKFVPANFQAELPMDQLLIRKNPEGPDVVPMDVLFVGAGPAGLSGAIALAQLAKKDPELQGLEIGVLDKAESLGDHNLSGAVVNPKVFRELFPDLKDEDFPFRKKVTSEKVFLMTETGSIRIPTPPTMHNSGNYTGSLSEMVRWLGQKAEELGVNILPSFPADALFIQDSRVVGVRTKAMGEKRDGSPGDQYMPPTELTAQVTVLSEGTRGPLAQAFYQWQNATSKYPQIYALGVKELWKVKKAPDAIYHTLGWPLPKEVFGGSWMYPLSDNTVSLGLVAGLDYRDSTLDVHNLLQHMKNHPLFKEILDGGECIEWGAKTIPEGGYNAIANRLSGDGVIVVGDAAGLVNVPALKGIHYAMKSGQLAGQAIFEALKAKETSQNKLKKYDQLVHESFIGQELKKVRNMRHAFKDGFFTGGLKAGLMTLTGGAFPGDSHHPLNDAEEWKFFGERNGPLAKPVGLSKVDAVYLSGNKTRDDIPQHLTVGQDISPELADFYSNMCPAGVYERQGDRLVVNAPNCVDCKATDVLGPRWRPREGGSGPRYKEM